MTNEEIIKGLTTMLGDWTISDKCKQVIRAAIEVLEGCEVKSRGDLVDRRKFTETLLTLGNTSTKRWGTKQISIALTEAEVPKCEDAVSREEALQAIEQNYRLLGLSHNNGAALERLIKDLPSVTPEPGADMRRGNNDYK